MTAINRKKEKQLLHARLLEVLHYDRATGVFTRLISRGNSKTGDVAGSLKADGYIQIRVDGTLFQAARVAWFYERGRWPINDLDHRNLNRSDNRISNLRDATRPQNTYNKKPSIRNTSGVKGVCWHPDMKKWLAQITTNKQRKFLGYFNNISDAATAYQKAAKKYHGEFARW